MNAAAKAISNTKWFSGHLWELRISKQTVMTLLLLIGILATAIGIVYDINDYRIALSQFEQLEMNKQTLQMQWSQLLLEQASLATPQRIGQIAIKKLNMHLPIDKHQFLLRLHEKNHTRD